MAKTVFKNGDEFPSEFANVIFSHVHDGQDDDGHVAKINLTAAAEVDGVLPLANVGDIGTTDVENESDASGELLTDALNLLEYRRVKVVELSGFMELGGFASNQNINYYAQIREYQAEDAEGSILREAVLWVPEVMETATDVYLYIVDASIPAALRPSATQHIPLVVVENAGYLMGMITITPTGNWDIHLYNNSNFTNSAAKGIAAGFIRIRLAVV